MPTSETPELLIEILDQGKPTIPNDKLAYFRRRLRLLFHELIVDKFYQQENMTKADLARRIGKRAEVVNRLLGAPGNWTLDTVSDLLIALGAVPVVGADSVEEMVMHRWKPTSLVSVDSQTPENLEEMEMASKALPQTPERPARELTPKVRSTNLQKSLNPI